MSKPTFQGAIRCVDRQEFPWRPPFTRYVWTFKIVKGELDEYSTRAVILRFVRETQPYARVVLLTYYGTGPERLWDIHFLIIKPVATENLQV